jgi:hypothetical protein
MKGFLTDTTRDIIAVLSLLLTVWQLIIAFKKSPGFALRIKNLLGAKKELQPTRNQIRNRNEIGLFSAFFIISLGVALLSSWLIEIWGFIDFIFWITGIISSSMMLLSFIFIIIDLEEWQKKNGKSFNNSNPLMWSIGFVIIYFILNDFILFYKPLYEKLGWAKHLLVFQLFAQGNMVLMVLDEYFKSD